MNNSIYRGDTFWRTYKVKYDGGAYTFKNGDKITVAFIKNGSKYLTKEIVLDDTANKITVEWQDSEMKTLKGDYDYILEAEIKTDEFTKTYQENIMIKKDYIV